MDFMKVMLAEFDQEMANTRRTLERVPEGKAEWRPHPRSTTLGRLAGHVAELPMLAQAALENDSLDLAGGAMKPYVMSTREELLRTFDEHVAAARQALAGVDDDRLAGTWSLRIGERVIFNGPRLMALRAIVVNHIVHHRAQLGVYLRLNDVPVPAIYGPSADEGGM